MVNQTDILHVKVVVLNFDLLYHSRRQGGQTCLEGIKNVLGVSLN